MADAEDKAAGKKPAAKKAAAKKDADQPAAKKAKTVSFKGFEPKAAQQGEEEAPEAISLKGTFAKDLRPMMYGFGDDVDPLDETVDLVEDMVIEYATGVLGKAMDGAAARGRLRPGSKAGASGLAPEDIMFVVRKDPKKYLRVKELLAQSEEIKKARSLIANADDLGAVAEVEGGGPPSQEPPG